MKRIAFVSQPEYFRFMYEHDLDSMFEVREFTFKFDMTKEDFKDLKAFNADYNFFFRGEFFPKEILKELKGVKIAFSSEPFPRKIGDRWEYTKDSLKRYIVFRSIRNSPFDYVFHYDVTSSLLFEKDGISISGEFVFPVATNTYKSLNSEKRWDFFFVGRATDHRDALFNSLKHRYNFLHIAHGIWGPDLVDYISKSKICLNAHAELEVSWEPRIQMMLSCGAFVMSEKITPNKYLRPGVDYVEYDGEVDLRKKSEYYLAHRSEREKIANSGRKRVLELLDSKKVFPQLITRIEKGEVQKYQSRKRGNILFDLLDWAMKKSIIR